MPRKKSKNRKSGKDKWWKYLLNMEFFFGLLVVCFAIYMFYHTKRKRFQFNINAFSQTAGILPEKKKKKRTYNKHENRCREIFEDIFERKFKSVRPDWLKNPVTGKNLELDGFCDSIETKIGTGLAYEYDGKQHSNYVPHFHRGGVDEFKYQMKKDEWKDLLCKNNGILLIRIPHFVDYNDLDRFIKSKLAKQGL